jgi:predicted nucleotidyltransferase component of viral defense system
MANKLFHHTVTPFLLKVLKQLMTAREFKKFRLVGGTALSLQLGHRFSVDIDLFTDEEYGSINFKLLDKYLCEHFPYIQTGRVEEIGMGTSYFIGESIEKSVKLDLFYTDEYILPILEIENIRMANMEEIAAMKLDVIARGGRKKDFWDIHALQDKYSFNEMLSFYEKRYPYGQEAKRIKKQFLNFEMADEEPDPVCLLDKKWEIIKLDIIDFVKN